MTRLLWPVLPLLLLAVPAPPAGAHDTTTWAAWEKRPEPIFTGQYIASDPSIVHEPDGYRMTYTCFVLDVSQGFDPDQARAAICEATSPDGLTWTEVPVDGPIHGLVMQGREGAWDTHLEGSELVKTDDGYLLYFSGYRHEGDPALGFPAALEVATSVDGVTFTRAGNDPVLAPTPGWYDNDAVYSPTIVRNGDEWLMVYTGHCYTDCDHGVAVVLLAATSEDGLSWTKLPDPVLEPDPDLPWMSHGVAEAALVPAPDGRWYLFFTGLLDEERAIGAAVGDSPLGPWEINPDPIVKGSTDPKAFDYAGVLAPFVLIEGGRARMWFLGMTPQEAIAIGYAEAPWPFVTRG